jgi:hypothetical protein
LLGKVGEDHVRTCAADAKEAFQDYFLFIQPGVAPGTTTVRNTHKPKLPDDIEEYFLTPEAGLDAESLCYVPAIIQSAAVVVDDAKRNISCVSIRP